MLDTQKTEIQFCIKSLREAAKLAKEIQSKMIGPAMTKTDRSPVTVADFAVQALIARDLQHFFPDDILVGEESSESLHAPGEKSTLDQVTHFLQRLIPGATPQQICDWIDHGAKEPSKRFWTLDPIDGTKGFLRREQYVIALALIEDGVLKIGALGCPHLSTLGEADMKGEGSLFIAVRGEGSWVSPLMGEEPWTRLHVSACEDPTRARLIGSRDPGHTDLELIHKFSHALGTPPEAVLMDSLAKYAALAAGAGDLLLRLPPPRDAHYREWIWDLAAGAILVEEAGGTITDIDGKSMDYSAGKRMIHNSGVLASNHRLHSVALETLKKIRVSNVRL